MIRNALIAFFLCIFLVLCPIHTLGCSLSDGYLKPSNYDLVKQTGAIVLAEAVAVDIAEVTGQTSRPDIRIFSRPVWTFKIMQTLNGAIGDITLTTDGDNQYLGNSPENDFSHARPGAGTGACNAYDYSMGKKFLLFLNKSEGKWVISGPPFSRINEEVSGAAAPWVSAVRQYIQISKLNDYEKEKLELRKLQKSNRADRQNYSAGLDQDIDDYFDRPYPNKSFKDLYDLYLKGNSQLRQNVLWAFAHGKHPDAQSLIRSSMMSSEFIDVIGPVTAYIEATQDYSSIPILGEAYLRMKDKQTRWPIMRSLIRLARMQDMPMMLAVLKSADAEEAGRLSSWFVRNPNEEATRIIRQLAGSQYEEKFYLAISLAGLKDMSVVEWAKEAIAATENQRDKCPKNSLVRSCLKRGLALTILASSPLPEADAVARDIVLKNDPEDIAALCEGYLSSPTPNQWMKLREIPNLKAADAASGHSLKLTLRSMAAQGNDAAKELIRGLD